MITKEQVEESYYILNFDNEFNQNQNSSSIEILPKGSLFLEEYTLHLGSVDNEVLIIPVKIINSSNSTKYINNIEVRELSSNFKNKSKLLKTKLTANSSITINIEIDISALSKRFYSDSVFLTIETQILKFDYFFCIQHELSSKKIKSDVNTSKRIFHFDFKKLSKSNNDKAEPVEIILIAKKSKLYCLSMQSEIRLISIEGKEKLLVYRGNNLYSVSYDHTEPITYYYYLDSKNYHIIQYSSNIIYLDKHFNILEKADDVSNNFILRIHNVTANKLSLVSIPNYLSLINHNNKNGKHDIELSVKHNIEYGKYEDALCLLNNADKMTIPIILFYNKGYVYPLSIPKIINESTRNSCLVPINTIGKGKLYVNIMKDDIVYDDVLVTKEENGILQTLYLNVLFDELKHEQDLDIFLTDEENSVKYYSIKVIPKNITKQKYLPNIKMINIPLRKKFSSSIDFLDFSESIQLKNIQVTKYPSNILLLINNNKFVELRNLESKETIIRLYPSNNRLYINAHSKELQITLKSEITLIITLLKENQTFQHEITLNLIIFESRLNYYVDKQNKSISFINKSENEAIIYDYNCSNKSLLIFEGKSLPIILKPYESQLCELHKLNDIEENIQIIYNNHKPLEINV